MKGRPWGRWLVLAGLILCMFGGCTAFSGKLIGEWTPAFLIWVGVVVPLKAANDRVEKVKWPMEFIMWSVLLLIAVNLVWLRYFGA